jgi:predicted metal-dependent phosphoesterase TrpH
MFKCDFHLHSMEDPMDVLDHDAQELVDHASRLGYEVLALTLHRRLYHPPELAEYAEAQGILLISGAELYLDGSEVVVLGITEDQASRIRTLNDLRQLRQELGDQVFTMAPHPYYGLRQCAGPKVEKHPELFDALEYCHFYTTWWNPNKKAQATAEQFGKPMIACSDTHILKWMDGHHYNVVDADEKTPQAIFQAIREGKVSNVTRPLTTFELMQKALWHGAVGYPKKYLRDRGWIKPHQPRSARELIHG